MNTDLVKHTMGACGEQCCQYEGHPTIVNTLVIVAAVLFVATVVQSVIKNRYSN